MHSKLDDACSHFALVAGPRRFLPTAKSQLNQLNYVLSKKLRHYRNSSVIRRRCRRNRTGCLLAVYSRAMWLVGSSRLQRALSENRTHLRCRGKLANCKANHTHCRSYREKRHCCAEVLILFTTQCDGPGISEVVNQTVRHKNNSGEKLSDSNYGQRATKVHGYGKPNGEIHPRTGRVQ